jgi:hypothetical protein
VIRAVEHFVCFSLAILCKLLLLRKFPPHLMIWNERSYCCIGSVLAEPSLGEQTTRRARFRYSDLKEAARGCGARVGLWVLNEVQRCLAWPERRAE